MAGQEVTDIHREGKVYDVMVWSPPSERRDVESIRELLVDTAYGGRVRLAEVAEIKVVPTPNKVKRENSSRRIDVQANVRDRDLGSVAEDVAARLEKVQFPIGYYPQLLGEYKERQAAQRTSILGHRGGRNLPDAPGVVPELEARDADLHRAARGARRQPARRLCGGRDHLAWVARGHHHRARHRGAQQHHARRALPLPRATKEGEAFGLDLVVQGAPTGCRRS